jgi:hypothetical protein
MSGRTGFDFSTANRISDPTPTPSPRTSGGLGTPVERLEWVPGSRPLRVTNGAVAWNREVGKVPVMRHQRNAQ